MKHLFSILVVPSLFFVSINAWGARGGGGASGNMALGISASVMSANQSDVNTWIDSLKTSGNKNLGSGYEFSADFEYRYSSSMFALMFRPSYFTQSADGGGVEASMTGATFFPILRLYPLENSFIKFFMQVGVGYGSLKTELKTASAAGSFDGSAFGGMAGIGAQFCFIASHCMVIEGNARYLPIERNTGSANGTLGGSITQTAGELELSNKDLGTTLSGIQGILGYRMEF